MSTIKSAQNQEKLFKSLDENIITTINSYLPVLQVRSEQCKEQSKILKELQQELYSTQEELLSFIKNNINYSSWNVIMYKALDWQRLCYHENVDRDKYSEEINSFNYLIKALMKLFDVETLEIVYLYPLDNGVRCCFITEVDCVCWIDIPCIENLTVEDIEWHNYGKIRFGFYVQAFYFNGADPIVVKTSYDVMELKDVMKDVQLNPAYSKHITKEKWRNGFAYEI